MSVNFTSRFSSSLFGNLRFSAPGRFGLRSQSAVVFISQLLCFQLLISPALAANPQVSNVRALQRTDTKKVDIYYDVYDADSNALTISVEISTNKGLSYSLPASSFSGNGYGAGVTSGTNRHIVWNAGLDWNIHVSSNVRIKVRADDGTSDVLPPEPASVAPTPSNGVVSLIGDGVEFLFTGTNPVQTGVAPGTMDKVRVAVLRGRVLDRSNAALSGVKITVNNHAEYGQTLTRTNGLYDLAVNGGEAISINYRKSPYLSVQRTVVVPWQDYVNIDDVVMIGADTNVMVCTMPSTEAQAVYGAMTTDGDGTRRAMVIIPSNTHAYIFPYTGGTQEISTLTTHLTEYTVGSNGPSAMPGDLPATVGYTYCIQFAAEEAQRELEGRDVLFSTSVYFYVDNFLGMPTGVPVPMGFYLNDRAAWVPSQNGIVIQLLGTNGAGLARISVVTNGTEADSATLAGLGFTDGERELLAQLCAPCTGGLWRVPIQHFSPPGDANNGQGPALDSKPPAGNLSESQKGDTKNTSSRGGMGDVEIENQVFRESLPIAGTPFSLNYSSARVRGNKTGRRLIIPVSRGVMSTNLQRMYLDVNIAGCRFTTNFAPATNLDYTFVWNGKDAFNRTLAGTMDAFVKVTYSYPAYYLFPVEYLMASFGVPSGTLLPSDRLARTPFYMPKEKPIPLTIAAANNGLGGWEISVHHRYDPVGRKLYLGSGAEQTVDAFDSIITTVAGIGVKGMSNIGGPATNAMIGEVLCAAVGPDGTVYFGDESNSRFFSLNTNGNINYFAGGGAPTEAQGTPATNVNLAGAPSITTGPDGSIYVGSGYYFVYKILTNGLAWRVAGYPHLPFDGASGDGGCATNARFDTPQGLAVAADGTLYIADTGNHRVRRVGPDGIITTCAGTGAGAHTGDGGPATNAAIAAPRSLALGPDGALYITESGNNYIRRVGTDGIISTVAGNGTAGFSGDGGAATNAQLNYPWGIAVGKDGSIYFADMNNHRIRVVTPSGIILSVAGTSAGSDLGDRGRATAGGLNTPKGIALGQDGSIYITDRNHYRLRQITTVLPGVNFSDVQIASPDGSEIYEFNSQGRHMKTFHAMTGALKYSFGYTNGWLASITDGDGNVTTIERAADGTPQAIVSPYNQRTELTLSGGFLTGIKNPANETTVVQHGTEGLLTLVRGAKGSGYDYTVTYDAYGRTIRAADPAGGALALAEHFGSNYWEVAWTSAVGRVGTNKVEDLASGDRRYTQILPDRNQITEYEGANGALTNIYPCGAVVSWVKYPDPRFGMQAPLVSNLMVRLPSGLTLTGSLAQAVSLTGATWTSVGQISNRVVINDRAYTTIFTASNGLLALNTPMGRQYRWLTDAQGRVTQAQLPGLATTYYSYDSGGRLTNVMEGTGATARILSANYNGDGYLDMLVDTMGRTNRWTYDAAGRVTGNIRPDGQTVALACDAHGNVTGVTPPGRPAHTFGYNLVDLISDYTPPIVGGATNKTVFMYNADRQITEVILPTGTIISNNYDSAGRLSASLSSGRSKTFSYNAQGLLATNTVPENGTVLSFTYDGGILTAERWAGMVTGQVSYSFDNNFQTVQMTVNTNAVPFGYDADGLLTNAGVCIYARDADGGWLTGSALGNVTESFGYNEFLELTNYAVRYDGSNLLTQIMVCDILGRITNKIEIVSGDTNTWTYEYDVMGRLVAVNTNGAPAGRYTYDSNGNRTNANVRGNNRAAIYDAQDRLLTNGSAVYAYDAAGYLTNKTDGGQVWSYGYDPDGSLTAVSMPGATNVDYLVDGRGRRIGRRVNTVTDKGLLYDGFLSPVAELDPATTNIRSLFVYGTRGNVPDYMIRTGIIYRLVCDYLGSVRLVVNVQAGEVVQRMDFDEFGCLLEDTNPGFQPFGFAGGLHDSDTRITHFGNRDYDPDSGRWTARDPILFNGVEVNLYAYCADDPVNWIDPFGLGAGKRPNGKPQMNPPEIKTFPQVQVKKSSSGAIVIFKGTVDVANGAAPSGPDSFSFGMVPVSGPSAEGASGIYVLRTSPDQDATAHFGAHHGQMVQGSPTQISGKLTPGSSAMYQFKASDGKNMAAGFWADEQGGLHVRVVKAK